MDNTLHLKGFIRTYYNLTGQQGLEKKFNLVLLSILLDIDLIEGTNFIHLYTIILKCVVNCISSFQLWALMFQCLRNILRNEGNILFFSFLSFY